MHAYRVSTNNEQINVQLITNQIQKFLSFSGIWHVLFIFFFSSVNSIPDPSQAQF